MKATKGEWIEHDGQIYPEETGVTIALIPYFDPENEEQQANVKLMAASKELLEALKKLLASHHILTDGIVPTEVERLAEQVINKAEQS